MKEFAYINVDKLNQLVYKLSHSEFNMLLYVIFYLSSHNLKEFSNNTSTREQMASLGFARTPERICAILSSLVKKEVLERKSPGIYAVVDRLFLPAAVDEIFP